MKIIVLFLTAFVWADFSLQAGDPPATPSHPPQLSKPTWDGDEHDQPVFTSPTNAPAITNLPAPNLPAMTNGVATNSPTMTNPPVLQPSGGRTTVK
jgi:hypothetical protein